MNGEPEPQTISAWAIDITSIVQEFLFETDDRTLCIAPWLQVLHKLVL
jgi:hypothetical protein